MSHKRADSPDSTKKNEHGTCFPFDVVNCKGNNPQIHAMQTPIFLCFFVVSQYPEKYPIRCQVSFQVHVGHEGPWYNNPHSTDSTHKCPRSPFVTSKAVDVQIHATSFCWCHLLTRASRCYVSLFWGETCGAWDSLAHGPDSAYEIMSTWHIIIYFLKLRKKRLPNPCKSI